MLIIAYGAQSYLGGKKVRKFYSFFQVMTLIIISSFRYHPPGSDYHAYIYGFFRIAQHSLQDALSSREPGYQLLMKGISQLTNNPQIFFIISGCIIVYSFYIFFIRYSKNNKLSMILFYMLGLYFYSHNVTRQFLAISICLWAYHFAVQKKLISFLMTVLLASTFHLSAWIALILYPICYIQVSSLILIMYALSVPSILYGYEWLVKLIQLLAYEQYRGNFYGLEPSSLLNLALPLVSVTFVIMAVLIKQRYKIKNDRIKQTRTISINQMINNRSTNLMYHLVLLETIFTVLQVQRALIFERIGLYFSVGICLLFPYIISLIAKPQRKIMTGIVLVGGVFFFLLSNYLGRLSPTPYDFYWNHF